MKYLQIFGMKYYINSNGNFSSYFGRESGSLTEFAFIFKLAI